MHTSDRQRGFTLIEMIVTISIGGILMAISVWGMRSYLISTRESGTASDVRSVLRNTAERALSEGRTYCVNFTSTSWTVYSYNCTVAADKVQGPFAVQDSSITLTNVSFPAPATPVANQTTACPTTGACAYFYPRGTALTGSLQVTRTGKTYTVKVEGLTSRVSFG